MSQSMEFEVRIDQDIDIDELEKLLCEEINQNADFRVEEVKRKTPLGMTGGDIAISFVVSVLASVVIHVNRNGIDAAVKRVSEKLKIAMRLIFHDGPK